MKTLTPLEIGPLKVLESTTACTLPVAPGLMTLSKSATVQPQAGWTLVIWRSASPSFLIRKSWTIFSPLGTVPTSLTGSATVAFGLPAARREAATKRAAQSAKMTVFM